MSRFLLFAGTIVLSIHAWAWGDLGHQTVADIAEQLLTKDREVIGAIQEVIGVEPLAMASTWPDHARSDSRFKDFSPYHYTTIYRDPAKKPEKDAITVLEKYSQLLANPLVTRDAKMVAFRYLVHVAGDISQPLHVGNEFDKGGNSCLVKWQPTPTDNPIRLNLHETWDTNLVNALVKKIKTEIGHKSGWFGYKELANELLSRNQRNAPLPLPAVDIKAWINDSAQLRIKNAYPDSLPDDQRPYCVSDWSKIDEKVIPVLDNKFIDPAVEIVEQRILIGGIRLAALLKATFKDSKATPIEDQVLNSLKLTNDAVITVTK